MGAPGARRQARGEVERLPSGSLRVRVYVGIDPDSRKRRYLTETVPAGPAADREAEEVRARLLEEVVAGQPPARTRVELTTTLVVRDSTAPPRQPDPAGGLVP